MRLGISIGPATAVIILVIASAAPVHAASCMSNGAEGLTRIGVEELTTL